MEMERIRAELRRLAEPAYRDFQIKLTPGAGEVLGVRLPALQKLAAQIARADGWRALLDAMDDAVFEEQLLRGLVTAKAAMPLPERLSRMEALAGRLTNWAVCDSTCCAWKPRAQERPAVRAFLEPLLRDDREFVQRFALVMLLHYVDEASIGDTLRALGETRCTAYYARMAAAWTVSVCYVSHPERTEAFLTGDCPLDDFTYNKALQKITESRRVTNEKKARIRQLRR